MNDYRENAAVAIATEERKRLRDMFAAAALTGLLARQRHDFEYSEMAEWAYRQAEAMLNQRNEL